MDAADACAGRGLWFLPALPAAQDGNTEIRDVSPWSCLCFVKSFPTLFSAACNVRQIWPDWLQLSLGVAWVNLLRLVWSQSYSTWPAVCWASGGDNLQRYSSVNASCHPMRKTVFLFGRPFCWYLVGMTMCSSVLLDPFQILSSTAMTGRVSCANLVWNELL